MEEFFFFCDVRLGNRNLPAVLWNFEIVPVLHPLSPPARLLA